MISNVGGESINWWINYSSINCALSHGKRHTYQTDKCTTHESGGSRVAKVYSISGAKSNWTILRHVICDWIAIVLAVMPRVNILIGQVNAANVPPTIHPPITNIMRDNNSSGSSSKRRLLSFRVLYQPDSSRLGLWAFVCLWLVDGNCI